MFPADSKTIEQIRLMVESPYSTTYILLISLGVVVFVLYKNFKFFGIDRLSQDEKIKKLEDDVAKVKVDMESCHEERLELKKLNASHEATNRDLRVMLQHARDSITTLQEKFNTLSETLVMAMKK